MGDVKRELNRFEKKYIRPIGDAVEAILDDPKKLLGVAIAVAFPGAGTAIGQSLLGPSLAASLGATATQVIGQTLINTAVNGGDVKSAVISAALPVVGKEATDLISKTLAQSDITGTVNDIITRGAAQGATAAVLGKDPLAAFVLGGATAGVTAITSNIPDFDKLPKPAQNAIGSAIATQVTGGDIGKAVSQSVINDAIAWAKAEVNKVPDAIKAAQAKYKADGGGTLTDEQIEQLLTQNGADKLVSAVDSLYTSKAEAAALWEKELGYKPSEFDLMELTGLAASDAKSIIDDKSSTTYDEAEKFLKDLYGTRHTPTKDEITSLMGLKEFDAQKQAGQQYNTWVDDRNTVTNDELTKFLEKAGLKEDDLTESQLLSALKTTEAGAETYFQRLADQKATTFDGEKYKSQVEAQNAAIKNGYNTYTWGGKSYTLMSPEQAQQLQADRAAGKNVGVSPDFITPIPGKTLKEQLEDAGNPDQYAYMEGDAIVIVAKRFAVPDYNDAEAWAAFKAEKDALGGDNFQSYLTEKYSILEQAMKGAPEGSVAKMAASAAMWGYGKVANLAQTMMRTAEAAGMSPNTAGIRIANQVEGWSKKLADQGVQNAEAAVFANIAAVTKDTVAAAKGVPASQISDAELYYEKGKALLGQVKDNPLGVGLFVGGEMIQEVPFLAASGGVGRVFASVAGKTVGVSAALGTNAALNGAESFGGNYGEVKDYLMKRGVPEDKAHALAVTSGLEAMGVSMVTSYVGDRQLVRAFVGDIAKDSFAKLALTTSTKEWLLGNVEGYMQNVSAQIGKYGEFKSKDEAMNAGIMEGLAQKGLATGVLTAEKLSQVVAKDKDGNDVTYKDIISGSKTFDPTTINKSFSFGEGLNLGDAIGYHSTFTTNPDITPEEYFSTANFFRSEGLEPTAENVAAVVGGEQELSGEALQKAATAYADLNYVTASEAAQLLQDYGYQNPTQEQINQFVGAKAEADVAQQAKDWAAQNIITQEEAEEVLKNLGYPSPPKEMVDALVGQYAQSELESRAGKYKIATAGDVAGLAADVQAKYDALTADQKALADALAKQGIDLNAAIDAASQQAQQQVLDLGTTLNTRIDELVSQGKTQYEATQQAISELGAQNVELQGLIGTQARQATQQDIDALTSMLSGQQAVDLAYDVTGDKQITQADIDLLNRIVAGQNTDWSAPAGSPWAATGLYGQIAETEAKRQADLKAAEAARQADIQAQIAREQEAARQAAIRTTAGQAQAQIQGLIGQLPGAIKSLQTTTTPIYAGEIKPFDFESPLDVGFLSPSKEKQTSQPGQQATKIASGGYLDDLLNLLR